MNCFVIGGGVIGLSVAYELSAQGIDVTVLERGEPGREASWAGAGILPAAVLRKGDAAYDQLSGLSHQLHAEWAERLKAETGIDTGYRPCGELHLARDEDTAATLAEEVAGWRHRGIAVREVSLAEAQALAEGGICASAAQQIVSSFFLPNTAQLRNPRHLKALAAACQRRGVEIISGASVDCLHATESRVVCIESNGRRFEADVYCLAAGAWSGQLLGPLGARLATKPIRGQMVLFKLPRPVFSRLIHEGPHYLVPRDDGHILAGSTLEDVGFDKRTTAAGLEDLTDFAQSMVAELQDAELVQSWAGLRPGSPEGVPYLGAAMENLYVATGHFRWGLFLSPGTAVVIRELITQEPTSIDLADFRLDR